MSRRGSTSPVILPCPERVRKIPGSFGWLDARLLHEDWLSRLGAEGTSALSFLALAANREGASYYGREKMARLLGMRREEVDRALARLIELELVAHRPWSVHGIDGVWQVLPVPDAERCRADGTRPGLPAELAEALARLVRPP